MQAHLMNAPGLPQSVEEVSRQVVLVVDDMPENLQVVGGLLSPDYRVLVANSGARALALAQGAVQPDLILLDVMMPEMDGYTVLAQLKANSMTAEIPVIFLTAMNAGEDEAKGILLGAVDYLVKPVQPVVLQARVRNQLALSAARQALHRHRDELELRVQERTAALEQARQDAEAASYAKTRFLGNMGHELRTPMAGVISMLDLLLAGDVGAEARELASVARESAESLLKILNEILDFADVDTGQAVVEVSPFGAAELLETLYGRYAGQAAEKRLVLETEVMPGMPDLLEGGVKYLRKILEELLVNALKFTKEGRVRISAEWSGTGPNGELVVFVSDTGPGLQGASADQLFEPFVQGDDSISRQHGGLGLGLAIAARMSRLLGGKLGYEPARQGSGSIFRLQCPCTVIAIE